MKRILPTLCAMAFTIVLMGLSACSAAKAEGPKDEVVRKHVGDTFKQIAEASGQKIDFEITKITRGDVLESQGARGIPAGTLIFPLKSMVTIKKGAETSEPQPLEFFFFKDTYGEWQSYSN